MKKQLSTLIIATSVLAGSVVTPILPHEVSAASVQQKGEFSKEKVLVNGQLRDIQYTVSNKQKLYSASDLAKLMSATVSYEKKSKAFTFSKKTGTKKVSIVVVASKGSTKINGKEVKLNAAPKIVGNSLFVEAKSFIQAFGGDLLLDNGLLVSTASSIKWQTSTLQVDGQPKKIRTVTIGGKSLYSVSDLANWYAATVNTDKNNLVTIKQKGKTSSFKILENTVTQNGKKIKIGNYPIKVKGIVYADLKDLTTIIGGELVTTQNGPFISVSGLISGDTFNPQWVNNTTVLAGNETTSGAKNYLINVDSKKSSLEISGTEVSVSPSGKSAIYTDEKGIIYLTNLTTNKTVILNDQDDNEKFEFVWSKNEDKVYFFNGKDTDKIYNVNVKDGALTKVYADAFKYKSDLHLSNDGQKLIYSVSNEAKTNYTDSDNTDVSDIDLTDTEPQLFSLDLNAAELKPLQLTVTKDNKVFVNLLNNGNVVYTSYSTDSNVMPVLYMIDQSNKVLPLVTNKDIIQTVVTAQGKLFILVAEKNGYQVIYEVNASTKALTKVAQTKLELTSFSVSIDGKRMAVTSPGKNGDVLMVVKNGFFEAVTK